MACATLRTFSNVKSSAMTPRQPSVPNLMPVTFSILVGAVGCRHTCHGGTTRRYNLEQIAMLFPLEPFYDPAHFLGAITPAEEQGVRRLDNDEVVHADGRNEFLRAVDIVARRVQCEERSGGDIPALPFRTKLVDRGP